MPSSTNPPSAVARHAARVKDAFRFARSRATRKQTDAYALDVAKKILSSDRSKAIEYVVALVVDVAQRGSLEEAESIGLQLAAIARAEHAAAHPDSARVQFSVAEAHMAEEVAEGEVEQAETAMAHDPSVSHCLKFLAASAAHSRARRQLDEAVRRVVAVAVIVVFWVICCVCQAVLVEGTPGALVSHTYCPLCFDKAMAALDAA